MDKKYIELLKSNGFNCFPIKKGHKLADYRYNAENTVENQEIKDEENYGYIPKKNTGTCIVDFDTEDYGKILEGYAKTRMIVKSPHGYHLPVKGLTGNITKTELFDYDTQVKKIIEIQGPRHYCVGPGSHIDIDEKTGETDLDYISIGTDEIMDVNGLDFHEFITKICEQFNVTGKKKNGGSYAHLREKVKDKIPPGKGQSNDYFNQAAMLCNTPETGGGLDLSRDEAMEYIMQIYHKWEKSDTYSGRPWSNIEQKINEAYDKGLTIFHGNHKQKKEDFDSTDMAKEILEKYSLYSDKESGTIYEEINGFVKVVTNKLKYRIAKEVNSDIHTTNEILFQITANARDLPNTDDDIIVFKNGYYRISSHSFHEHDDNHGLAIMGFEDYDYKQTPNCPKYEKFMSEVFPDENMRNYAYTAASCCVVPEHQIRITMCYGEQGTGKTTYREILSKILGEYVVEVDNNSVFNDMFGLADWENKTFVSLGEAPKSIKEFDKLKRITGESKLIIRKMHTAKISVPNRTKMIMDTNNLFRIPEDEAGPMFDRLHLLEFIRRFRYTKDDVKKLSDIIAEEEGEDVLSMLLQVYDPDNPYPSPKETKNRWEDISIPEKAMFKKLFEYHKDEEGMSPMDVKVVMEENNDLEIDMTVVRKLAKDMGYQLINGVYKGLTKKKESTSKPIEEY